MVGGRLYTSNGEEIKDLRQKSVILSKINSKSLQPIGADNDTVKSSTVIDNQELDNIGTTDGTQSGINQAVDTKIGEIDASIYSIQQEIESLDTKAYKIKGSKTVEQINALTEVEQGDVYNISDDGEITEGPDEQPFDVKAGDNIVRVQDTTTDPETGEETPVYFWDKFTSGAIDFSAIDGEPTDNDNLKNALDAKQDLINRDYFAANADFGYLSPYKYSRYDDGQGGFTGNQQAYIKVENNPVFYAGSGAVAISNAQDTCEIQLSNGGYVFFLFKQDNQEFNNLTLGPNAFNFSTNDSSKIYINRNGMYFFDGSAPVLIWNSSSSVFKTGNPNGFQFISNTDSNGSFFVVNDNRGGATFMSQLSVGGENVSFICAPKHNAINYQPNFVAAYTPNDQSTYAKIAVHGNVAFQSQHNIDNSNLRATEPQYDASRMASNSYQTLFYPNQNKMIHYGGFNSNNVAYGEKLYLYSPYGLNVVTLDDFNGLRLNGSPIGGSSEVEFVLPVSGIHQKIVDGVYVNSFYFDQTVTTFTFLTSDVVLSCDAVVQTNDYSESTSRVLSVPVTCSYDQASASYVFSVDVSTMTTQSYATNTYNLIIYYKKIVLA